MPSPKCCDTLQSEFPTSLQSIPSPMSRRKARSWPSARGAARSKTTAAKAAADREKTVAITDFASEPCNSHPPELERTHPTKLIPRVASEVGHMPYAKVRPFGGRDSRGAAYGVRASWRHGADGLRAVPGVHDFRTRGRRGDLWRDPRQGSRCRRQLRGHRRRLLERRLRG